MIIVKIISFIFIANYNYCNSEKPKKIESLPNFRRKIEEIPNEKLSRNNYDDTSHNLVSFLVNNVKQIFTDTEEPIILLEPDVNTEYNNNKTSTSSSTFVTTSSPAVTEHDDKTDVNQSIDTTTNESIEIIHNANLNSIKVINNQTEDKSLSNEHFNSPIFIQKSEHEIEDSQPNSSSILNIPREEKGDTFRGLSCITCNNVISKDCDNPKNKLIPSTICKSDKDLCYSQHTPFGIVNRGCYNVHHTVTTFVCSCNLCNYISIYEMPHIFSTKRDWIENVIELSRTRNFRKSIFKDMSCLTCEVISTTTKNLINNTNCLEGSIRTLPIQECARNEICGVKAIRSNGYIWRGCLASPLYNYWWTLCDSDFCNYDSLVSIYEELT